NAKSDIVRSDASREKTGVPTGAFAVNPINGEKVPVFVADYVIGSYGTGAAMAVPAHDERDHAFAVKYGLPTTRLVDDAKPGAPAPPARPRGLQARHRSGGPARARRRLALLREGRQVVRARDQHDAAVGGLVLVLPPLPRSEERRLRLDERGLRRVDARRPLRR